MAPRTLLEAVKFFANRDNCREYLVARRWPNGVTCPTCGLGVLLIVRSFRPPARRRTPRVSRRDKVAEMLRQAGIESVTPGGLVACCAAVGGSS